MELQASKVCSPRDVLRNVCYNKQRNSNIQFEWDDTVERVKRIERPKNKIMLSVKARKLEDEGRRQVTPRKRGTVKGRLHGV